MVMEINEYLDEFLNGYFLRDFRCLKTYTYPLICRAMDLRGNNKNQKRKAKVNLRHMYRHKNAKYHSILGETGFYSNFQDYKNKNTDSKMYNHFFFDYDIHDATFDEIKKEMKNVLDKYKSKEITLNQYFKEIEKLQDQITELIFNNELVANAFNESQKVNEYFEKQGWKTYHCFSGSKGIHGRVFFEPCHLNNYNQIVKGLAENLIKTLNLKTLDEKVVFDNPSGRSERLPYSYNEKSGLIVTPFNVGSTLDEVLSQSEYFAKHGVKIDEFNLSDYTNFGLSSDLKHIDKKMDALSVKEKSAKNKLFTERKLQGIATGKYYKNNNSNQTSLFSDLRRLVQFVCGSDHLVKEYETYDKYYCVFHEDKHPSAIVGSKYYTCHSSNCKIGNIGKINYFDFIKHYFNLKNNNEVKEKMVQLQNAYNTINGTDTASKGGDVKVK